MINTLTLVPPTRAMARQVEPEPVPAPEQPVPAPPMDAVDFNTIDCPVKAALMPVMDPAVLAGVVVGALVGGSTGAFVSANILTGTGAPGQGVALSSQVQSSFVVDPSNPQTPIIVGGLIGDVFDSGELIVDEETQTAKWVQSGTELDIAAEGSTVTVDGHIGSVETHLKLSELELGRDPETRFGIHTEGTLGAEPYTLDTTFVITAASDATTANAVISSRGSLGGLEINKEYCASASESGGEASLRIQGQGCVAGVPTQVEVEAHLAH